MFTLLWLLTLFFVAAGSVCVLMSGNASAQDENQGCALGDRLACLAAAERGNARAQTNLGIMYENGQGVPQSDSEAVKWYRKGADGGNAVGQNNLGAMYDNGRSVEQDFTEALKWFRLAADHNNSVAQNNIGYMNEAGRGTPQNYEFALKWYRLAADGGNAKAQNNLGALYEKGLGVKQDYAKALKFYRQSADKGNAQAQYNLGLMNQYARGTPYDYKAAMDWYRLAARNGNANAKMAIENSKAPIMIPSQPAQIIQPAPIERPAIICPSYADATNYALQQANNLAASSGLGGNHNAAYFYAGAAGLPGFVSTRIGKAYVALLNDSLEQPALCRKWVRENP